MYRILTILIFVISHYFLFYILFLPINLHIFLVTFFSYFVIFSLFLETITFSAKLKENFLEINTIFYKRKFDLSKIEYFRYSHFCVKIRSEGKKYTFPPMGGCLRKVEELLQK
ncbi:hypothetical protein SU69_05255 [Thermosipho melanesiensis]|uniref:Uncharacterized protein n=1 Tax=Thermosipho melanesiensis TaxID=46541 RepID=A0ABN4UZX8_9BACT|nr:hypothetical protein BW47_05495 [Thermosipho melanesiensis]OOC35936.1 hypothetical protein SU68_05310 [Thermosipho melanesiensis]OOC38438.1 hypothetical protein SU69_05255 [Thermosipho melanesiensis]OOC38899.1 hypothetical protein SU70_05255 [Thermosipho melanesiensis]OOC41538.1 hypothetical protein SU71_05245 [Thermosipho melanesiensis]